METTARCSEVEGKTTTRFWCFDRKMVAQELLIEFTDGTALPVTIGTRITRGARLIRLLEGPTETI